MKRQYWLAEALNRKERMDERKAAELADEISISQATMVLEANEQEASMAQAGNKSGKLENDFAEVVDDEECQEKLKPEGSGDSISHPRDGNLKRARLDTSENEDVIAQLPSNSGAVMLAIESAEMLEARRTSEEEEQIKTKQAPSSSDDGPGENARVSAADAPNTSFTFGSINRRERPLRLLSDPVGNADVVDNDDGKGFWQCKNCPIRSRIHRGFCIGCGLPRKVDQSEVPKKPKRLSHRNNDFSLKFFFGGSLSSAEPENFGFLFPTTKPT